MIRFKDIVIKIAVIIGVFALFNTCVSCSDDFDLCDCRLYKEVRATTPYGYRTIAPEYVEDYYIDDCDLDGKSIDKYIDPETGSKVRIFLKCN